MQIVKRNLSLYILIYAPVCSKDCYLFISFHLLIAELSVFQIFRLFHGMFLIHSIYQTDKQTSSSVRKIQIILIIEFSVERFGSSGQTTYKIQKMQTWDALVKNQTAGSYLLFTACFLKTFLLFHWLLNSFIANKFRFESIGLQECQLKETRFLPIITKLNSLLTRNWSSGCLFGQVEKWWLLKSCLKVLLKELKLFKNRHLCV